ncbi:hypothetical protein ONZ45_g2901 [Pleurotus djamor]|nr:hypothetical protein ONZ45_g2901 [Pleurotus djamor]
MGNKSFFTFIREQLSTVPPVEVADLSGKVVVVIGANTGIGYEAAKHYAKMGAEKVIMGCRSQSRGEDALRRLKEETKCTNAELRLIDLANFASVKAFVENFEKDYSRLDLLVANAGVVTREFEETDDGWEKSLQVNHLAQALLILLLLPLVVKTAEGESKERSRPRIVIVASEVHQEAVIPQKVYESSSVLESLSSKEVSLPYDPMLKYQTAKLLNVCFTRAFAAHLPSSPTTPVVDCVNPGLCRSELARGGPIPLFFRIMTALLARTAEEGARQLVWASIGVPKKSPTGKVGEDAMRGAYVSFVKIEEPSNFVISERGKEFESRLWSDTLRILSKLDDRIQPIIEKYLKN